MMEVLGNIQLHCHLSTHHRRAHLNKRTRILLRRCQLSLLVLEVQDRVRRKKVNPYQQISPQFRLVALPLKHQFKLQLSKKQIRWWKISKSLHTKHLGLSTLQDFLGGKEKNFDQQLVPQQRKQETRSKSSNLTKKLLEEVNSQSNALLITNIHQQKFCGSRTNPPQIWIFWPHLEII